MPLAAIPAILFSYLLGAAPFGYIVARLRGVDIFAAGSGNIGATNVGRVLGRKFGVVVFVLDFLKGAFPVALVRQEMPDPPDEITRQRSRRRFAPGAASVIRY